MFPEIPDTRTGASASVLRGYVRELREYARTEYAKSTNEQFTAETRSEAKANAVKANELAKTIKAEAELADVAEAEAAAEEALAAELEPNDDDAQASDTGDDDDDDEVDPPLDPAAPDVDVNVDVGDKAASKLPALASAVPTGLSTGSEPARPTRPRADLILARDGVPGLNAGEPFGSWAEVGEALRDRWSRVSPASNEKFEVAYIPSQYPDERKLTADPVHNMRMLQNIGFGTGLAEEITAALCAPLTPYYGMACENTLRRPVAASLPGFEAPRGGVSIMPSPSLSDVSNAGIWTHEDDDDDEATKECDELICGTPEDFVMYAVYWCLTVKNWHLLTFPELVEAFLNRGLALRARVAERQLLEQMAAGVPTITVPALGYGSTVTVTTQVLTYLSLLREEQRFDNEPMVGWAHRWLLDALRVDQSRRRRDGTWQFASEEEINAKFRDVGVDMTWSLDVASWMTPPAALAVSGNPSTGLLGTLGQFGGAAEILIAPRGKYAMIDRAQLSIGVTGNNYYRDTAMIEKNQVRFFVENYEGVVDTTSCDSHLLEFSGLCHNGVQIADVEIDCDATAA